MTYHRRGFVFEISNQDVEAMPFLRAVFSAPVSSYHRRHDHPGPDPLVRVANPVSPQGGVRITHPVTPFALSRVLGVGPSETARVPSKTPFRA